MSTTILAATTNPAPIQPDGVAVYQTTSGVAWISDEVVTATVNNSGEQPHRQAVVVLQGSIDSQHTWSDISRVRARLGYGATTIVVFRLSDYAHLAAWDHYRLVMGGNLGGDVTVSAVYDGGTGGGSGDLTATYILQTADVSLSSAQALGALAGGILKSAATSGIVSIATAGTDYVNPSGTWAGNSSITTVGTIGTGVWQGTAIASPYIATNAVTYSKIQATSAGAVLLGNPTGSAGAVAEITLGANLSFSGTTLVASVTGGGGGTVTSVTFTGDGTVLSATPSTAVTASGTLTATLATQTAHYVLAGPPSAGPSAPTFRALAAADLPTTGLTIGSHISPITADTPIGHTATCDLSVTDWHSITLDNTGTTTIALSNPSVGQQFSLLLAQDSTGTCLVTWFSGILWPGGTAPTLTTSASKRDLFTFKCTGAGVYLGMTAGQSF